MTGVSQRQSPALDDRPRRGRYRWYAELLLWLAVGWGLVALAAAFICAVVWVLSRLAQL